MECFTNLRIVADLLFDGKTPYERRFGQPFKGPIIPFCSLVEYHPKLRRTSQESVNLERKSYLDCSSDTHRTRGEFGKGDVLIADLETLEMMDASEIHSKKIQCKRSDISQRKSRIDFSNRIWTNQTLCRRSRLQNIHLDTALIFLENQKGLFHHLTTRFRIPVKQLMIFGPCQETSYTVITLNPESSFTRREKNPLSFPLKYIGVSRNTRTNLDVKQEKRIDDYWNIDWSRDLSDPWTGFTQFLICWKKNLQTDLCGPGRDERENS